jgi:hypothetical protein
MISTTGIAVRVRASYRTAEDDEADLQQRQLVEVRDDPRPAPARGCSRARRSGGCGS